MDTKNKIIANTVKYLQDKYGINHVLVKDYWEEDENAIGLVDENEKLLVYISVYHDDNDRMFYLSLEELTPDEDFPYKSVGDFNNLTLSELESIVAQHLKLLFSN